MLICNFPSAHDEHTSAQLKLTVCVEQLAVGAADVCADGDKRTLDEDAGVVGVASRGHEANLAVSCWCAAASQSEHLQSKDIYVLISKLPL